jgi:hypothetical protein
MSVYQGFSKIVRVLSLAVLVLPVFAAGCGSGGGGGGDGGGSGGGSVGPPDNTAPTVTAMTPDEDTTGIATDVRLTVTFGEAMAPAGINTDFFRLTDGANPIPGTVSYDTVNNIAVFTPSGGLAPGTRYTATMVTGVKDLAGNPLTIDFAWCFSTGATVDGTAPSITATTATGVPINRKISVTFSEDMNSLTLIPANFTVTGPGTTPVSGTVTYHDRIAVFAPNRNFAPSTPYTATVTTGVRDLAGNALPGNATWNFTTDANADVAAPVIASIGPVDGATGVAIGTTISASFNEPMDPATITTANFRVTGPGGAPEIGIVAFNTSNNTATFTRHLHLTTPVDFHPTPVSNFAPNTTYTVTLTTGARDMAGNALASDRVWSFTTAP